MSGWEQGHRQVTADEWERWRADYPRPLAMRVHESVSGFILHIYEDPTLPGVLGGPRCVASIQPSSSPTVGPIYRIHGEPLPTGRAA